MDPDNFNLRLKNNGSSPFIGKGNSTNAPEIDNDGNIRGSDYDIGCYAFNPISPTPLSPSSPSPSNPSEPSTNNNGPTAHVSSAVHVVPVLSLVINVLILATVL